MSSKSVEAVSVSPQPAKPVAEPPAKIESAEESRRRRAGIACFL